MPTDTVEYTYKSSASWGDMIDSYGANDYLPHDGAGNLRYDGTWTYNWENGRELVSMTQGETAWTFSYDANGMRTKRTDGQTDYTYVYNGDKLVRMIANAQEYFDLSFTYDANGTPLTITENGYTYYYVTNLQGDVVGIKDSSGQQIVSYVYDAWGNLISHTNTQLADYNPLRYRGYVYDWETGLYYLQSRYYDPEWGRFINADIFPATGQGFVGNNMFAYCGNNPVIYYDLTGFLPQAVFDKIVHNLVLAYICLTYNNMSFLKTCIYYNGKDAKGGWGFCDLYNTVTGEVWELKKESNASSCQTPAARAQLDKYVKGRLKHRPNLELCIPSTTHIKPEEFHIVTDSYDYRIWFYDEGNGILRYNYTVAEHKSSSDSTIAAALIALALVVIVVAPYASPATGSILGAVALA